MRVKLLQTIEETEGERPVRFPKGSYCNFSLDRAAQLVGEKRAEAAPGPELLVTSTENPSNVIIAFTYTGSLKLFIGDEEQATPPTSPITVQRGASMVAYRFVVVRNDARGENVITIAALEPAAKAVELTSTKKARSASEG